MTDQGTQAAAVDGKRRLDFSSEESGSESGEEVLIVESPEVIAAGLTPTMRSGKKIRSDKEKEGKNGNEDPQQAR